MARLARVMLPECPFHLTHRGNHRQNLFRGDDDRLEYLELLGAYARKFDMEVWAFCLMHNHVHLIAIGRRQDSIPKAIGNTHRVFSRRRNREREVTGHLWANRFFSTALDEPHLWTAVRYVELNPVRAGIVVSAPDYPWSSARLHSGPGVSKLLDPRRPFPGPIGDWAGWLALGIEEESARRIRRNTLAGRPCGNEAFLDRLESQLGRRVRRLKPGPRKRAQS